MASKSGTGAPASLDDAIAGITHAITAAMMVPDVGSKMPILETLLKATIGMKSMKPGTGGPPGGAPPGGPPGAGGGTNIAGLMGAPPQGPSAGTSPPPPMPGAPAPPSTDAMRSDVAEAAA